MDEINLENAILYADSSRGVYIPQYFAESIKRECVAGVTWVQWGDLISGQDCDYYWDTWSSVLDNATVTMPETGIEYGLYQDGDLWLVPLKDMKRE